MKKTLAAILAVSIIGAALISCSTTNEAVKSTESTSADTSVSSEVTTEAITELKPELPEKNYDGQDFKFLVEYSLGNQYESREIYSEGETGELINDSVFRRNVIVEDQFNIKITKDSKDNAVVTARKSIQSGENAYNVVMPYINVGAVPLATENLLLDLNTVPYLEISNPWWDQRANENLRIRNKLFFTTGDISYLDNDCTMVMFFNKDMIKDYNLDNPYDLVNSGDWTIDKLWDMSKGVTSDFDGDGIMTGSDVWGLSMANNAPRSMFFGAGERIVKLDDNGDFELVMYNDRSQTVLEKILAITADPDTLTWKLKGNTKFEETSDSFINGRIMFVTFALVDITFLRDMKYDFGILPYPKYESEQIEYNNLISTAITPGTCVPVTVSDPEMSGIILESMAYNSVNTLSVAYYDNALNTRYVRDTESSDMLDIIFNTRVYDLGYIFDWGGLGQMIDSMAQSGKNDFASEYAKREEKALTSMKKLVDSLDFEK